MSGISGGFWALLTAIAVGGLALAGWRWRQTTARCARMAAELQDSESRFRFVAENSNDVIWTMDLASGRFSYVSPAIDQLSAYSAAEVMANPALAAFSAASSAKFTAALAELVARWDAGERNDLRRLTEVGQRHRDGRLVSTEAILTLRGDERGPRSVLGISRELSDRQPVAAAGGAFPGDGDDVPLRFHWWSAYECGLPALDREHQTLFDNANDLLRATLEPDRDPARFMAAVDRLLDNVQQHFADEEVLLQRIAYPELAAHARRHRELVLQATHLREEARAGRISVGDWIEFVANDVVVGHLIRDDRKFFPLLALATAEGLAA